jgi:hypothetical protein
MDVEGSSDHGSIVTATAMMWRALKAAMADFNLQD